MLLKFVFGPDTGWVLLEHAAVRLKPFIRQDIRGKIGKYMINFQQNLWLYLCLKSELCADTHCLKLEIVWNFGEIRFFCHILGHILLNRCTMWLQMWCKMVKKPFFSFQIDSNNSSWPTGELQAVFCSCAEEGVGLVLRVVPKVTVRAWGVACCPAPRAAAAGK